MSGRRIAATLHGALHSLVANKPQLVRHFVGKHFFQAEAEEMRCITTVGTRDDVAAEPRGPAGPPVAGGAAV